ncbi:Sirohydrochlorin ferrochelatase [Rhynchospora pubera]|uniref:Sirohydrochlorin ferrochelatase n=1 Tax=Rhynchospora pubera TaxID=906938 RepID=A0AAV8ENH6_9POAL|nr:Sirohydrochlorin ferrochelatase [Rhynchospora pubera]
MRCSSASSSPAFFASRKLSRDCSKGRIYLISPKFVKSGGFVGKERIGFPMNCSASSSNQAIEASSEIVQRQIGEDKVAVLIVDHGSRREESNLMLNDFVKMFEARTSYQIVEPAHMELAEPTIKDAFRNCVQRGATRVIVSPFFLFPGRHWHKDIPSLVAEACKEHTGVSYVITAPLGLHELLVDVMSDRIKQCVSHVAGVADECDVCAGTGRCRLYP